MYIVADIGGTKMRMAKARTLDRFEDPVILDTPVSYEEGISLLIQTGNNLAQGEAIRAVAAGITGVLTDEKRSVVHSNIPDWDNRAIARDIEAGLGSTTILENDTALVGLGEALFGAGIGVPLLMYMTVSTGVNAVRIVDGRIDSSAQGFETGEQYLFLDDEPLQLSKMISGKAVSQRYAVQPRELGKDSPVWETLARIAAYGIYNSIVHWSPDKVVLGGSMFNEIGIPIPSIRRIIEEINVKYPTLPEIVHSRLGDVGGLYGGLARLKQI